MWFQVWGILFWFSSCAVASDVDVNGDLFLLFWDLDVRL